MSDAAETSSWGGPTNPPQTSDVPMPDAVPEAAASSSTAEVNPWAGMDGVGDATMASAVPSAAATRANRWATEMSDDSDGQKSQAAMAAAEMEEQEREAVAALAANQEKALQKQKDENARRKSLGGGSLSAALTVEPQQFTSQQAAAKRPPTGPCGATGSSSREPGFRRGREGESAREVETAPTVTCDVCNENCDGSKAVDGFDLGPLSILCSWRCQRKCDRRKRNRDNPRCYGCNKPCAVRPDEQAPCCDNAKCSENILTFERLRLLLCVQEDRLKEARSYFFTLGKFDVADYKYGQKPNQTVVKAQIDMILFFADERSQYALQAWEAFTTFQ